MFNISKKFIISFVLLLNFFLLLNLVNVCLADEPVVGQLKSGLDTVGDNAGYNISGKETGLTSMIGSIVSIFLGLLGVIFVILTVYAGWEWMSARGEEAQVTKAKDTLWRAVIGLIIVVSAYAIWGFVYTKVV